MILRDLLGSHDVNKMETYVVPQLAVVLLCSESEG